MLLYLQDKHITIMCTHITKDYLAPFFLGLMDGNGSIQVNHSRKKILQFRMVIKLKFNPRNYATLSLIASHLGGTLRENQGFIFWSENHQRRCVSLLCLLKQYPPLTKRMQCQLAFFQENLKRKDIDWYLSHRGDKYKTLPTKQKPYPSKVSKVVYTRYFGPWCSGFIEAKGSFVKRKNGWPSFSIAHKDEKPLLELFRDYFGGTNQVQPCKGQLYLWEVSKQSVLQNIVTHCQKNPFLPLLGQRKELQNRRIAELQECKSALFWGKKGI